MSRITTLRPTRDQTTAAAIILFRHLAPVSLSEQIALSKLTGARVFVKHEYATPTNSFKIRGALTLVDRLKREGNVQQIVTASTGNHGASMAYACQIYDFPITVVVPEGADESKVALIKRYGANLEYLGHDLDEAKERIMERGLPPGHLFIEDGGVPEIVVGASTIGLEITELLPEVDIVFVPVGNGSLIGGIGTAIKAYNPSIKVIGVQSKRAPSMALSFKARKLVKTERCDTFATGMAVRVPIPEAVDLMLEVVDDMVLVSETELKKAIGIFYNLSYVMLEGAGAAPLAGCLKIRRRVRGKTVCLIASGANLDRAIKQEILETYA